MHGQMIIEAADDAGIYIPAFVIIKNYRLLQIVACVWLKSKKSANHYRLVQHLLQMA